MSDWLHLIGWPPSIITGGLLIFLSLGYGTQARQKLRPILLAVQVALLTLILSTLYNALHTGASGMLKALLIAIIRHVSRRLHNKLAYYKIMFHHSVS